MFPSLIPPVMRNAKVTGSNKSINVELMASKSKGVEIKSPVLEDGTLLYV